MELKIDPKRFQDTIRNDFEQAKPRRSEKKEQEEDNKNKREGETKSFCYKKEVITHEKKQEEIILRDSSG